MNQQRTLAPVLIIGAALSSLFVIVSVLMGQGNHLAKLFRYLLLAGFVAGILFPRPTLVFWMVLCGYTDLLKRLMVVFGDVEHSDLFNVLGIPPMMVIGVTLSILVGALTHRFQLSAAHWRLFAVACVLVVVNAAIAAKESGGSLSALAAALAVDCTYTMLLFVVPVLFRDSHDVVKLARFLLWAYVPMALYGVYQQVNGFQDFEIAYLKTGLTVEIKQLYTDEVRAFSTLNSPTAFSVVCGVMCALSVMLNFTPRRAGQAPLLGTSLAMVFSTIYFAGIVASASRSAMLLVAVALVGFLCFRSGRATRFLYAAMVVAFVALVAFADAILSNLDVVQDQINGVMGDGQLASQLSRVGTFSDRLHGFANLVTNPDVYTFFGHGRGRGTDPSDPLYAHDIFSNVLVVHGVVPLLAFVIVGCVVLTRMHKRVLSLEDRHHRLLATGFVALALSFVAVSLVSGSVLGTFPVNALFWLCLALLTLVYQSDRLRTSEEGHSPSARGAVAAPQSPHAAGRFVPSAPTGHL
jgi:hypothetical protein